MFWPAIATAAVLQLAPGCHRDLVQITSGAPPFTVIGCDLKHVEDHQLLIVNDGSDGDLDRGDVLLGFQVPR